jgi:ATF/CREB family transcription factor
LIGIDLYEIAALKCRQRKKAWLQALQAKVEFLTTENERLSNALVTSREEVARLSQAVVAQGGAPSALLTLDPNGPSANGSTIMNGGSESTASPVDHARRNSSSSTTTTGQPTIQNSQPLHVNVPPTMTSGLNHGMTHHGHSHSMGHNGVANVGAMGHTRSHSHGHGHAGVPAQNGVTVGGRGYGY